MSTCGDAMQVKNAKKEKAFFFHSFQLFSLPRLDGNLVVGFPFAIPLSAFISQALHFLSLHFLSLHFYVSASLSFNLNLCTSFFVHILLFLYSLASDSLHNFYVIHVSLFLFWLPSAVFKTAFQTAHTTTLPPFYPGLSIYNFNFILFVARYANVSF